MRKKWMILVGCFLGGILICGLGVGIGFVEFSHFTYAGERTLGTVTEETLTYSVDEKTDICYVRIPWNTWNTADGHDVQLISDNSLPEGTIEIDVAYNDDYEKPYLSESEWTYDPSEPETVAVENEYGYDEITEAESMDGSASAGGEANDAESRQETAVDICMVGDPAKIIMRYKDQILEDMKNDKLGAYSDDWEDSLRVEAVRYHPSLQGKVKLTD